MGGRRSLSSSSLIFESQLLPNLSAMGSLFRRGAHCGLSLWLFLLGVIFGFSPAERYEQSQGIEQQFFFSVSALILITNSSRFIPLTLRENGSSLFESGVLGVVLVIQAISITGCFLLAAIPTPVYIDPFTGMRCHLVLWANFIALSFLMSFLTENLDAVVKNRKTLSLSTTPTKSLRTTSSSISEDHEEVKVSWFLAVTIALSAAAGIIAPFCPNFLAWCINMTISWILFFALYWRLYKVAMRFLDAKVDRRAHEIQSALSNDNNNDSDKDDSTTVTAAFEFSPEDDDCYELYRLSFIAHLVCSVAWTLLAGGYCFFCFVQQLSPEDSILANPAAPAIFLCICEVLSKVLFLSTLLEAYESVFDDTRRRVRHQRFRLEKQLVQQVTSRKMDASAVRFSRHEVKNGILSAVGVVEQLEDAILSQRSSSLGPASICNSLHDLQSSLHDVLDRVADDAMSREIVHGEYQPRYESINIPAVFSPLRRGAMQRFTLRKSPPHFPLIRMDRALLRCIYRNALSNACRYGKPGGIVETTIRFIEADSRFELQVTNLPGPGHDQLLLLNDEQVASIFKQGTQLKVNRPKLQQNGLRNNDASSGDGAWIVQNCAKVVGGKCWIRFTPALTIFTFTCRVGGYLYELTGNSDSNDHHNRMGVEVVDTTPPAQQRHMSSSASTTTSISDHSGDHPPSGAATKGKFQVPPGTWGIAIDDSKVQRKLLNVYLKMVGIGRSRRIVLGESAQEIFGFRDLVEEVVRKAAANNNKILVIADENLDVVEGGAKIGTVSGSESVEKLLSSLDKDAADRMLCLIRSANDSDADLRLYKSRSHGYLLKQPIKRDDVRETVRKWWVERFPFEEPTDAVVDQESTSSSENEWETPSSDRGDDGPRRHRVCDVSKCDSVYEPSEDDIRTAMEVIDSLFDIQAKSSSDVFWPALQDRLFALKGDLKTIELNTEQPEKRLEILIAQKEMPKNGLREWLELRKLIDAIFAAEV